MKVIMDVFHGTLIRSLKLNVGAKITCWQIKPSKLYLKSVIIVTFDLSLMQKSKN